MGDRVQDFLNSLNSERRHILIRKQQRTVIRFANHSRIVILPNSPQLLRGYSADRILPDEANFFNDDELIFYSVLYPMLATTDGSLVVSSTPWNRDSVFYKMCNSPDFSKHVVTCEDAISAGLIKRSFIEQMQTELPAERFRREFYAEFNEDADTWLTQSLIVNCIDNQLNLLDFRDDSPPGNFFLGLDFGKHHDFSVLVALKRDERNLQVIHVHRFPLNTNYASVIGYVKYLQNRWKNVRAVYADITGVGDYVVEDMTQNGITNVSGISFTVAKKEEMATILREKMRAGEVKIPYTPAESLRDVDLTAELNVEKFELLKTGHIKFSHPEGSHDDLFWAFALAVYGVAKHPVSVGIVDFGSVKER